MMEETVEGTSREEFQATIDGNIKQLEQLKKDFDLGEAEELHRDLVDHIDQAGPLGSFLKHPIIFFAHYDEVFNAHINKLYLQKKKDTTKALKEKNWKLWIWLHERPYRLDAFITVCKDMNSKDYWPLLKDTWVDAEFPGVNKEIWVQLFTRKYSDRRKIMTGKERRVFNNLPKNDINIYRGYYGDEHQDGISWTLSYDKASWFAKRFAGESNKPLVAEAVCDKEDILAYFDNRKEEEIIIDSEKVIIRRSQPV